MDHDHTAKEAPDVPCLQILRDRVMEPPCGDVHKGYKRIDSGSASMFSLGAKMGRYPKETSTCRERAKESHVILVGHHRCCSG